RGNIRVDGPDAKVVVQTDAQHVAGHLDGGGGGRQLRAVDLVPVDGDFGHTHAQRGGDEQQLDVKRPALDVLVGEEHARGAAREELEAALRVANVAHAQ